MINRMVSRIVILSFVWSLLSAPYAHAHTSRITPSSSSDAFVRVKAEYIQQLENLKVLQSPILNEKAGKLKEMLEKRVQFSGPLYKEGKAVVLCVVQGKQCKQYYALEYELIRIIGATEGAGEKNKQHTLRAPTQLMPAEVPAEQWLEMILPMLGGLKVGQGVEFKKITKYSALPGSPLTTNNNNNNNNQYTVTESLDQILSEIESGLIQLLNALGSEEQQEFFFGVAFKELSAVFPPWFIRKNWNSLVDIFIAGGPQCAFVVLDLKILTKKWGFEWVHTHWEYLVSLAKHAKENAGYLLHYFLDPALLAQYLDNDPQSTTTLLRIIEISLHEFSISHLKIEPFPSLRSLALKVVEQEILPLGGLRNPSSISFRNEPEVSMDSKSLNNLWLILRDGYGSDEVLKVKSGQLLEEWIDSASSSKEGLSNDPILLERITAFVLEILRITGAIHENAGRLLNIIVNYRPKKLTDFLGQNSDCLKGVLWSIANDLENDNSDSDLRRISADTLAGIVKIIPDLLKNFIKADHDRWLNIVLFRLSINLIHKDSKVRMNAAGALAHIEQFIPQQLKGFIDKDWTGWLKQAVWNLIENLYGNQLYMLSINQLYVLSITEEALARLSELAPEKFVNVLIHRSDLIPSIFEKLFKNSQHYDLGVNSNALWALSGIGQLLPDKLEDFIKQNYVSCVNSINKISKQLKHHNFIVARSAARVLITIIKTIPDKVKIKFQKEQNLLLTLLKRIKKVSDKNINQNNNRESPVELIELHQLLQKIEADKSKGLIPALRTLFPTQSMQEKAENRFIADLVEIGKRIPHADVFLNSITVLFSALHQGGDWQSLKQLCSNLIESYQITLNQGGSREEALSVMDQLHHVYNSAIINESSVSNYSPEIQPQILALAAAHLNAGGLTQIIAVWAETVIRELGWITQRTQGLVFEVTLSLVMRVWEGMKGQAVEEKERTEALRAVRDMLGDKQGIPQKTAFVIQVTEDISDPRMLEKLAAAVEVYRWYRDNFPEDEAKLALMGDINAIAEFRNKVEIRDGEVELQDSSPDKILMQLSGYTVKVINGDPRIWNGLDVLLMPLDIGLTSGQFKRSLEIFLVQA